MKLKVSVILTVALFALAAAAQSKDFINYKHKGVAYGETLPNGARDLGGGLLSNEDYGVTRYAKGKKFYLWLEKITSRDTKGVPNWIVRDVLDFDAPKKNQEFLFSLSSTCTHNGRANPDLIVLAETPARGKKYKVLKAWRVNLKREKFESVSTQGVRCGAE
jgi:hypothetical protein